MMAQGRLLQEKETVDYINPSAQLELNLSILKEQKTKAISVEFEL